MCSTCACTYVKHVNMWMCVDECGLGIVRVGKSGLKMSERGLKIIGNRWEWMGVGESGWEHGSA